MQYTQLKQFFLKFLEENKEPYPLKIIGGYSSDIRVTIRNSIEIIDSVPSDKLKGKGVHHSAKSNLLKIHDALKLNDQSLKPKRTKFDNY